ncbi:hypothetical protein OCU04_006008 [Sclerotinia nivalis]|uniref:DUF6594 domain-containing protein n=1 Tax=Sclerotinia nivalis TaxID=352851 RepID=A0A9X0AM34_9HELO|nr:hypothetical protein OCU04_006008 [Sclerotinia nivalis]
MAKKPRDITKIQASQPIEPASPTATSQSDETVVGSPTSQLQFTSGPWEEDTDPFKDPEKPLPGWPLVSKLIAKYPDLEAFKAFRDLNVKSLLYYQAELENLRMKLHQAEYNEYRQDDALLQYSQITALPRADPYNVETLRVWLKRVGDHCIIGPAACTWGDYTESVRKVKPLKWQFTSLLRSMFWPTAPEPDLLDLVVPRQGHKVDSLTRWVANEFVPFWHSLKQTLRRKKVKTASEETGLPTTETKSNSSVGEVKTQRSFRSWLAHRNNSTGAIKGDSNSKSRTGLTVYSEARMLRFTSSIATVIACLLPTVAIAVLSSLQSTVEILGVIAAFTAIFAIGLMFLTDAGTSRVEIFTATAAFSAVMVVFVQNQNVYIGSYGNSSGSPGT